MNSPASSVSLLPIPPEESGNIRKFAERIWPAAYRDIISPEQIQYMLDWMYAPKRLREEITSGAAQYFWIEREHRIGFLAFGPMTKDVPTHLYKFYILPEFQRFGYGSMAFDSLFSLLESEGVSGIELRVNKNNSRAIRFYQKNRFEIVREDCADIGDGFEMDDFILFRPINLR